MLTKKRKTTQKLLPDLVKPSSAGLYDIYPGFKTAKGAIRNGYHDLAGIMAQHKIIRLEGYAGVFWEDLVAGISAELELLGLHAQWFDTRKVYKTEPEIDELAVPFLGENDPVFGKRTTLKLQDFFDPQSLLTIEPDPKADINIVFGPGAALSNFSGPVFYVDLPKNELQFRMRAGSITNLGKAKPFMPKAMYKRFYFLDWVILNEHKRKLLPEIELFVDDQRPGHPFFIAGKELRRCLSRMSENFFRVRPWFEPGAWGGQWIKDKITQLSREVPNYAWSFELIVPENGLLLEDEGKLLECSFDLLMFQEYQKVLGDAADRFQFEFPIRFDFLDTWEGGNLSVQVHPKEAFIQSEFGENFTQDECYYILDAREDACVFLGFQKDVQPDNFRKELEESFTHKTVVDIEKHVNRFPAKKHDLFLIPSGTIHSAGQGNLVLEISATPYIFTFKLYDWLRLDLDGKPRPLNIERGFKNMDFTRKGDVVTQKHIAQPILIEKGHDWKIFHLPTHEEHFYDVRRLEFQTKLQIETRNQCHVMSLVEGTAIKLITNSGMEQRFNYAETFVVPAGCQSYSLVNEGEGICQVIQAFVKT